MLYNYTCLDILENLTLLEDLTIQRHAHDHRTYPSDFVFGQWASGLKRLMLSDPHLRILPSLTSLQNLDSLDLTDCRQLELVDTEDVHESLSTLILSRCSALRSVPPLTRFKTLTNLDLQLCPRVSDLGGLVNITSIVTLQLHGLPHLTELGPLGSLSNLRDLDLSVMVPAIATQWLLISTLRWTSLLWHCVDN